jgi:hypothetical protein
MNKVEVNRRNLEKMMKNQSNGEVYKRRVAELEKEVTSLLKKIAALQDKPKRRYTTPRIPRLKMCQGYVNRLENKLLSLNDTQLRKMVENSNVGNKNLFMNPRYGKRPQKKKPKTPSPLRAVTPSPSPKAKTPSPVKRKTPPAASPVRRTGRSRRAPQRLGQ